MKSKIILIASLTIQLVSSCKKQVGPEGAQGPQGSPGPVLTGNLKGFVNHYDVNGAKLLSNLAGDTLSIDGTSAISVTDANGAFTFNNLTTGSYNLSIKRAGFGATKVQNIQFSGGGDTYRNALISKLPTTNVLNLNTVATSSLSTNVITTTGTVSPTPYQQTILLFFGNPNATNANASSSGYSVVYSVNVNANVSTFTKVIPSFDFYAANFASGNTIAVAAYLVGGNTNASSYTDFMTNKVIYTALSPAAITATTSIQ